MKFLFGDSAELKLIAKVVIAFSLLFIVFLLSNYWYLVWISQERVKKNSKRTIEHIASDFRYVDGNWDVRTYFQDTSTPVDKPLYIISTKGFLIERMNPINGFFDTARFEHMSSFSDPQIIVTPSGKWRVYSYMIEQNGIAEGAVLTAYHDPEEAILTEIDNQLIETAEQLASRVAFDGNYINADNVVSKEVPRTIYYSIVDKFNRVLSEDGGPPVFIDRSFVIEELNQTKPRIITDKKTGEPFLITSRPLFDNARKPVGIIIAADSLRDIFEILAIQRNFSLLSSVIAIGIICILMLYLFGKEIRVMLAEKAQQLFSEYQKNQYIDPTTISFDRSQSILLLDQQSILIEYGSKQYDLCKTLFLFPNKRWEYDELLEKNKMDGELHNDRVFYDAMVKINSKLFPLLGMKLIVYQNKTFRINPQLSNKVDKS